MALVQKLQLDYKILASQREINYNEIVIWTIYSFIIQFQVDLLDMAGHFVQVHNMS